MTLYKIFCFLLSQEEEMLAKGITTPKPERIWPQTRADCRERQKIRRMDFSDGKKIYKLRNNSHNLLSYIADLDLLRRVAYYDKKNYRKLCFEYLNREEERREERQWKIQRQRQRELEATFGYKIKKFIQAPYLVFIVIGQLI